MHGHLNVKLNPNILSDLAKTNLWTVEAFQIQNPHSRFIHVMEKIPPPYSSSYTDRAAQHFLDRSVPYSRLCQELFVTQPLISDLCAHTVSITAHLSSRFSANVYLAVASHMTNSYDSATRLL